MEIQDRLKQIRGLYSESQAKFAARFGLPQSTYAPYEKGARSVPDEIKIKLNEMGINLNWLITGNGPMYVSEESVQMSSATTHESIEKMNSSTLLIPMTNMKLSAGKGWDWESDESFTGELLPVPVKIARRFNTDNLIAATVKGDSMEPRISDGDLALVHRQSTLENGELGVMVYGTDGEGTLKKYIRRGNAVVLHPFNPDYEDLVIKGEELDHLYIAGKVVETKTKW